MELVDQLQALAKETAVRFLEWVSSRYPNQKMESGNRVWTTAFLHENFGDFKTVDELYDLFIEHERKRLEQEKAQKKS